MKINAIFDTEASKGHVDAVYMSMNRPKAANFLAGGFHYKNNSDAERIYEANGMFSQARKYRVG